MKKPDETSSVGSDVVDRLRDGDRYKPNHWSVMIEAATEIERLEAEIARLSLELQKRDKCSYMGPMRDCPTHGESKDAARYRWLRDSKNAYPLFFIAQRDPNNVVVQFTGELADMNIDEMMEAANVKKSPAPKASAWTDGLCLTNLRRANMSYWAETDARRQADRDFERRGRPDRDMYDRYGQDSQRAYAEEFDYRKREDERKQEDRREEEAAEHRQEERRQERRQLEEAEYCVQVEQREAEELAEAEADAMRHNVEPRGAHK